MFRINIVHLKLRNLKSLRRKLPKFKEILVNLSASWSYFFRNNVEYIRLDVIPQPAKSTKLISNILNKYSNFA